MNTKSWVKITQLAESDRQLAVDAHFNLPKAANDNEMKLTTDGRVHIEAARNELIVYFHVVGQPIPVTAVTSPQAMISPLAIGIQND